MKRILLITFTLLTVALGSVAQNKNIQPSIMVVPFTKEGEDIRKVIEEDVNKRAVLTSIKEEFDTRGCSTIDFLGKFRARSASAAFNENNQTDVVSEIVKSSGADIFVTAEINLNSRADGAQSVGILLNAYDNSTGAALASLQANAGPFRTNDIAKLADLAIKKDIDRFLNTLQDKFNQMIADGRSIMISVGVDEGSEFTLESEVGNSGNSLADEIELWIEENSYKGGYHLEGITELTMSFDDVKIPLRDPKDETRSYSINKFSMAMNQFFKSLGVPINRKTNGNQLYISIK